MLKTKITKIIIYLLLALAVLLLVFLNHQAFVDTFFSEYIEDKQAYLLFEGDKKLLESPVSRDWFGVKVSKDTPASIELAFDQPMNLNGFSVFFYGDLHAVASYLAEDFGVYYKNDSADWILIDRVQGNRSSHYLLRMDENKDVQAFKMVISKATFGDSVYLGDLKFYVKRPASFVQGVTSFINFHNKSFFSYIWYTLIFYIILLIPGYTLLYLINNRLRINHSVEYGIVFSPIISIIILAILSTAYILTKIDQFVDIYILIFVISLFLFLKLRLYKELKKGIFPLFIITSVLLIVNLLQAERDFLFNLDYIGKYLDQLKFMPLKADPTDTLSIIHYSGGSREAFCIIYRFFLKRRRTTDSELMGFHFWTKRLFFRWW